MNVNPNIDKPIFIQIAEQLEDSIFTGVFPEETQIPSTNEISALLSINPHCLGSRTEYRLASEVLMKRTKFSLVCLIIRSPRFFRQSCMTVTVIGTLARIIQKLNCMRPWSNTQTIRLNLEI